MSTVLSLGQLLAVVGLLADTSCMGHSDPPSSGASAPTCTTGAERCGCYPNGTCNLGLLCYSDVCVYPSNVSDASSSGSGDSGATTGYGSGTDASTPSTGPSTGLGGADGNGDAATGGGVTAGSGGAAPGSGGQAAALGGAAPGSGGQAAALGGAPGAGGGLNAGGAHGLGGRVGSGGSPGAGGSRACGAIIDDMEARTGQICQGSGRQGLWFTYVDEDGTISPPPESSALPEQLSTPRGSSQYAMHIRGSFMTYFGFGCWLDNVGFSTIPVAYDATGYTGLHFWAKGDKPLRLSVQMPATEPTRYGGTCTASACDVNSYGPMSLSSSTWTEIAVPFSELTGGRVPFQPSSIWSIEFGLYDETGTYSGSFDLWIDDLTFF